VATTKEDRPPVQVTSESKCKKRILSNDSAFRCTCTFDLSPSLLTVSGRAQIILFFVAVEID